MKKILIFVVVCLTVVFGKTCNETLNQKGASDLVCVSEAVYGNSNTKGLIDLDYNSGEDFFNCYKQIRNAIANDVVINYKNIASLKQQKFETNYEKIFLHTDVDYSERICKLIVNTKDKQLVDEAITDLHKEIVELEILNFNREVENKSLTDKEVEVIYNYIYK